MITGNELACHYAGILNELGFKSAVDAEGNVSFNVEDSGTFVIEATDDVGYFSIVYPVFFKSSELTSDQLNAMANHCNINCKCAKVIITNDCASVMVQSLVSNNDELPNKKLIQETVIPRAISMISTAIDLFRTEYNKAEV